MKKIFDYKVKKIHLWERFLLLFIKPSYVHDKDGNVFETIKFKKMFGKVYMLKENVSVKRGKEVE